MDVVTRVCRWIFGVDYDWWGAAPPGHGPRRGVEPQAASLLIADGSLFQNDLWTKELVAAPQSGRDRGSNGEATSAESNQAVSTSIAEDTSTLLCNELQRIMQMKADLITAKSQLEQEMHLLLVERVLICEQLGVPKETASLCPVLATELHKANEYQAIKQQFLQWLQANEANWEDYQEAIAEAVSTLDRIHSSTGASSSSPPSTTGAIAIDIPSSTGAGSSSTADNSTATHSTAYNTFSPSASLPEQELAESLSRVKTRLSSLLHRPVPAALVMPRQGSYHGGELSPAGPVNGRMDGQLRRGPGREEDGWGSSGSSSPVSWFARAEGGAHDQREQAHSCSASAVLELEEGLPAAVVAQAAAQQAASSSQALQRQQQKHEAEGEMLLGTAAAAMQVALPARQLSGGAACTGQAGPKALPSQISSSGSDDVVISDFRQ